MDQTSERFQRMVGQRIRIAREEAGLNQDALAAQLGFPVRQTLSNIEAGKRKVTADELVKLIEVLNKSLDFFTDPLLLVGEAGVSWRAKNYPKTLDEFERKMLPVVALHRELTLRLGKTPAVLVQQLPLTPRSSFEEAQQAAEGLAQEWELGKIPAQTLPEAAETRLNLLVLMVDAPKEISGAAVHLPDLDTILINRSEPPGRRNYDFGHELFHLLTWHSMPPPRVDEVEAKGSKQKRIENLADAFTAALLMPAETVRSLWEKRQDAEVHAWIKNTATALGVSGEALLYRLFNLGLLAQGDLLSIDKARLAQEKEKVRPKPFSRKFTERLHGGLDKGRVSVRKAAAVLDCTIEDLEELFREYGLEPPFDL